MRLKTPEFSNYTLLPEKKELRQAFYLNNRTQVPDPNGTNLLLLGESQSGGGFIGANDQVLLAGDVYRWTFNASAVPQQNITINWTDLAGANILTSVFPKDSAGNVFALFEKLYQIPDGYYRITSSPGVPAANRTVFKHRALAANPPSGIIEIGSHPNHIPNSFREDTTVLVNGQNVPVTRINAKSYSALFQRRSLPWKYKVVKVTSVLNLADWSLQYGPNQSPYPSGITFAGSAADATTMQREYTSNGSIPFFQTPKKGIQLTSSGGNNTQPLGNMPNPGPGTIKKDNSGNLYAETIIHL